MKTLLLGTASAIALGLSLAALRRPAMPHRPQPMRRRAPGIRWKRPEDRVPPAYIAPDLGAIALFEMLPYLEELWRDWRANPGRLAPPPGQPHQVRVVPAG
jgi:hypothetical protein